jgi:hypothetical protein
MTSVKRYMMTVYRCEVGLIFDIRYSIFEYQTVCYSSNIRISNTEYQTV